MQEFEKELELIDTKYPFSIPTSLQLSVQIVVGLFLLAVLIVRLWLYCRHKSCLQGLWQLPSKVPDLLCCDLGPISKLFASQDPEPLIQPPVQIPLTITSAHVIRPTYHTTATQIPKSQPVPPSTSSMHSDDFDVTSLDETTPVNIHSECAKKKSTLDCPTSCISNYTSKTISHGSNTLSILKRSKRPEKPVDSVAHVNIGDDSNQDTPL